jgi:hypothetical protein
MKQTNLSFGDFCDSFSESYKNNFTYHGKKALYDYLIQYEEDTGTEIELDIVAFCCDYNEYSGIDEYIQNYNTDVDKEEYTDEETKEFDEEGFKKAVMEEIQNKTTLIEIEESEGFIIQAY